MLRQFSKSLRCSGRAFYFTILASQRKLPGVLAFQASVGFGQLKALLPLGAKQGDGSLLRWKRWADAGADSDLPLTHWLGSQPPRNAALSPSLKTAVYWDSFQVWREFRVYFSFLLNLRWCVSWSKRKAFRPQLCTPNTLNTGYPDFLVLQEDLAMYNRKLKSPSDPICSGPPGMLWTLESGYSCCRTAPLGPNPGNVVCRGCLR